MYTGRDSATEIVKSSQYCQESILTIKIYSTGTYFICRLNVKVTIDEKSFLLRVSAQLSHEYWGQLQHCTIRQGLHKTIRTDNWCFTDRFIKREIRLVEVITQIFVIPEANNTLLQQELQI
jgi:hypothetical protein